MEVNKKGKKERMKTNMKRKEKGRTEMVVRNYEMSFFSFPSPFLLLFYYERIANISRNEALGISNRKEEKTKKRKKEKIFAV